MADPIVREALNRFLEPLKVLFGHADGGQCQGGRLLCILRGATALSLVGGRQRLCVLRVLRGVFLARLQAGRRS